MRKRKPRDFSPMRWLIVFIVVGLMAVLSITVGALWQWGLGQRGVSRPAATAVKSVGAYPTTVRYASPYPSPSPVHSATALSGALFLTQGGKLSLFSNGMVKAFSPSLAPDAEIVRESPTQNITAYIHAGKLHLLYAVGVHDEPIDMAGQALSISWSPDGRTLSFVIRNNGKDTLYRTSPSSIDPIEQLSVPEFAAPPIWHPSTHRILIAEPVAGNTTTLYTIDGNCEALSECNQTRQEFMVLPFRTNWLDYQPSGVYIISAEKDSGKLYLVTTAKKDYQPIFDDGSRKTEPTFSPDGTQIVYLNDARQIDLVDLSTMSTASVYDANNVIVTADSLSWR